MEYKDFCLKVLNIETGKYRIYKISVNDSRFYVENKNPHFGDLWALLKSDYLREYVNNAFQYKNKYPFRHVAMNYRGDEFVDGKIRAINDDEKIIIKKITKIDHVRETFDILEIDSEGYVTNIFVPDLREIVGAVSHIDNYSFNMRDIFKISDASKEAEFINSIELKDPEI